MCLCAKFSAVIAFNFRVKRLQDWLTSLTWFEVKTNRDVEKSIREYKQIYRKSLTPVKVDIAEGWSPYETARYLTDYGLATNIYHPTVGNEWWASSGYVDMDDEILANKVSYYIVGVESTVTKLKLTFDIWNEKNEEDAEIYINTIMMELITKLNLSKVDKADETFQIDEGSTTEFDQATVKLWRETFEGIEDFYIYLEVIHKQHSSEF